MGRKEGRKNERKEGGREEGREGGRKGGREEGRKGTKDRRKEGGREKRNPFFLFDLWRKLGMELRDKRGSEKKGGEGKKC